MKRIVTSFVKIISFFVTWIILAGVLDFPNDNPAIWRLGAEFIPLLILFFLTYLFSIFEHKQYNFWQCRRFIPTILTGTSIGLFWIGATSLILLGTNQFTLVKNSNVLDFGIWILAMFLNVIMQELLIRGYIYHLLKEKHGLVSALIVTTLLFMLLHGGAFEAGLVAIINVLTMCLLTHYMFEVEGSLFAPIMAHATWNIVGGLFLGGIQLAEDYPSLFTMIVAKNNIFSGGDYKMEASLVVTFLNFFLLVFYYWKFTKKKRN